ncbi:MAG: NAD(P)/FAD-dependent oxidoreductase [Acutalibacteraceae bacterium]
MKIAIIGGGASGLACAVSIMTLSKQKGLTVQVDIIEKNERVGKKLLATGNGRCNLTNLFVDKNCYPYTFNFAEYALHLFSPECNIDFFSSLGLYCTADSEGRVYPMSNQASAVLDALRFSCEEAGVSFVCGYECESVKKSRAGFLINGERYYDKLVFACGAKSGVRNYKGFELLSSLGHRITKTAPSLVKLVSSDKALKTLKGIRAAAEVSIFDGRTLLKKEKGELQFGDNTISGIAVMQLSAFAARHFMKSKTTMKLTVDFVPEMSFDELSEAVENTAKLHPTFIAENLLTGFMPKKLGMMLIKRADIRLDERLSALNIKRLKSLCSLCKKCDFEITGTMDFSTSQVTAGGADTDEFDSKTMQSKKHKGLYCIGEMLDVDGLCGGYNLQWAWSSARCCALSIVTGE